MCRLLPAILAALLFCIVTSVQAGPITARVSISRQTMTISHNGAIMYRWKVSTARRGYVTPRGSWRAYHASRYHLSRKYDNAPMPYAIFYHGGYAIHGTTDVRNLGRPASHGCIRLHPSHAAIFFRLARRHGLWNTRVVVTR